MKRLSGSKAVISLISVIFILLVGMAMTGCATYIAKVPSDFTVPPPMIMQKIPLNAALLMPDNIENITFTGKPATQMGWGFTGTFPLGQLFKKGASSIFLHAFNNVTIVKGNPDIEGIDIIITPEIGEFYYEFVKARSLNPFNAPAKALASVSLKYTIIDKQGILLWEKTVSSPKIAGKTFNWAGGSAGSEGSVEDAAAKAMVSALQESVKLMVSSSEIHAYASAKGKPETLASEVSPAIKSDVDELPAVKVKHNKNSYAIVIGIEQYRQKLPKADFATQDAELVADYLTKALGYPEENVITLLNDHASNVDLVKYFEKWLPNNVEKDSTVFVYYSGHGAPNPKTSDAYLVPYDGDPSFIDETGYSLKRMYSALSKLPAKEVIVALDSCFSGAGGRSVLAKGARPLVMNLNASAVLPINMTVLSASSGDQISSTYDEKGHGLFTYFMLKGIKNEDVTRPDGSLKLDDLYSYVKPQVERIARKQYNNEQTPQLFGGKKR